MDGIGSASPTTLLCLFLFFVGCFLAVLFWLFRAVIVGRRKQAESADEPLPAAPQITPSPQPRPGPATSNPAGPRSTIGQPPTLTQLTHRREVMRILRDPATGALSIEIEGREYRRLAEVGDEQTGRTILQVITDLLSFTSGLRAPTPTPVTAPPPEAARSAIPPRPVASRTPPAPPPAPAVLPTTLPPVEPALPEEKPVPLSITDFFRRGFRQPPPKPVTTRSFIDEIEDILQRRLLETPLPGGQEMHVRTGPDGALQILLRGRLYNTPDEITDPAAREIIKAAVREWERS